MKVDYDNNLTWRNDNTYSYTDVKIFIICKYTMIARIILKYIDHI